jgi:hypothetical protein
MGRDMHYIDKSMTKCNFAKDKVHLNAQFSVECFFVELLIT